MTFDSMIENNNAAAESFPLKVTFGSEIRRATFGGSFENLCEIVAKLFSLDKGSVLLKYQDDDDDKITMSSDGELQDALKLVKEKNILRLFVEVKGQQQPAPVVAPEGVEQIPFVNPYGRFPFPPRPFQGRGPRAFGHPGHGNGLHHGGPHHGHGYGSHPHGNGPHHHGHGGPGPFRGGHGHHHGHRGPFGFVPAVPATPLDQGNNANPIPVLNDQQQRENVPQVHPFNGHGPWATRCAFKEHKRAMKEQIKLMKENAVTPDDKLAIKEFKQQMLNECHWGKWNEKMDKHGDKWNEKWNEKREKKWEKKHHGKCEKKDKEHKHKDKKDKKDKKEKKDRSDKLVARHVADVTIPDNSLLPPNEPVIKTWRLRNEGQTAWPVDAVLQFISKKGDPLNGPERVVVGAVPPQQTVEVSVPFITPSRPGRYVAFYRMTTGDGSKFGQRVWVSFVIAAPALTTAASVTAATANLTIYDNDVTLD